MANGGFGDDSLTYDGFVSPRIGDDVFGANHAVGGNDTLVAIGNYNTLYGDFDVDMGGNATGGNDILTVDGDSNTLYGDTYNMFTNAQGGNDTLTATGNGHFLAGDAQNMLNFSNAAQGGNDILTATGDSNTLVGDANEMGGNAQGGNDTRRRRYCAATRSLSIRLIQITRTNCGSGPSATNPNRDLSK